MIAVSMTVPPSALRYTPPLRSVRPGLMVCGKRAEDLVKRIAEHHGYTTEDVKGPSRIHAVAHVRQECMWALRETGLYSLPSIGRFLNRDHTTVLTGVSAHEARMAGRTRPPHYRLRAPNVGAGEEP